MAHPDPLSAFATWLRRAPWNEAVDQLLSDHIGIACADADMTEEEVLDTLPEPVFAAIRIFVIEDLATLDMENGNNAVDEFLKRRGYQLGSGVRAYLKALRRSHASLYRLSPAAGGGFDVRDQLTEAPAWHLAVLPPDLDPPTDDAARFVAGRILEVADTPVLARGWLPLTPGLVEHLVEAIPASGEAMGMSTDELLAQTSGIFTAAWLDDYLVTMAEESIAGMVTPEGEPIAFMLAAYELGSEADRASLEARLDDCPALGRDPEEAGLWRWRSVLAGPPADLPKDARVMPDPEDDLGTVQFDEDGNLMITVSSRGRLARARAILEPLLGDEAGPAQVDELRYREVRALAARGTQEDDEADGEDEGDEDAEAFRRAMTAHLRRVLDEPLEVIGNKVPRRAARSAKDRPLVVAWLKDVEKRMAEAGPDDPLHGMDVSWMWLELGLSWA